MTLTLNQHALDGLHLALDENPDDFALRLILADLYEEAGDELTAKAIRWQVKSRKRPSGQQVWNIGEEWSWYNEDSPIVNHKTDPQSDISLDLFGLLDNWAYAAGNECYKDYYSRRQAEEALWRAWAKWKGLA